MEKILCRVSWGDDESEFLVLATDHDDARARFLKNREKAGAIEAMRDDAESQGLEIGELVNVETLSSKYGEDVFSLDGEL
jgi:hypothetical protein